MTTNKYWRNQILEKLGIHGWDNISLYIFTCMLSGATPCIIGTHGSGKTMGFVRLSRALGLNYQLWDASKVTEETLGGMYNIEALKQGRQEYIKDPNSSSVWGKHIGIIDELTRSTPSNQNLLLELLRNKTFNGVKTDLLLTVATANDLSYSNTEPLDRAFAGRVGLVFRVPEIYEMSEEIQHRITLNSEGCDNLMLKYWSNDRYSDTEDTIDWDGAAEELRKYFSKAYEKYAQIKETYSDMFCKYVNVARETLHSKAGLAAGNAGIPDGSIDARRCGMIFRNIIAGIAVEYNERELTTRELQNVVEDIWKHSFTHELTGSKLTQSMLSQAHAIAQEYIEAKNLVTVTIMREKNPIRQLMLSIVLHDEDPVALFDVTEKIFTDAFDESVKLNQDIRKERQMQAYLLAIIARNKDGIFNVFKGKEEYAEILERISDINNKILLATASKLDTKLQKLRKETEDTSSKQICDYFDDMFCKIVGMSKEEVKSMQKRMKTEDRAERVKLEKQLREPAEIWIQSLQLLDLTLDHQTFDLDPQYVKNMFEKSMDYVKQTIDIIRADYNKIKTELIV